jgi:hypothetical protein
MCESSLTAGASSVRLGEVRVGVVICESSLTVGAPEVRFGRRFHV